jgi:hypothetical protein
MRRCHQFNQQVRLGHEPGDLTHPKCNCGNGAAQKKGSKPGKVLDGPTDIRHLVANVINPAAFLEGPIDGGVRPKGSYEFQYGVSVSAAQKANGDVLDGVVERARFQLVAEQVHENWNGLLQIPYRDSKVMKIKLLHANLDTLNAC